MSEIVVDPKSKSIQVGLVQITEPMQRCQYLPYSVLLLQSYAQAHAPDPARYAFSLPVFLREPLPTALERLDGAQIVAFSLYIWNEQYSLALARLLKQTHPEVLVVCGGPQVPDRAETFMAQHPYVDLCCHGEGEVRFLEILEAFPGQDWSQIAGLSYRDAAGQFQTSPKPPRLRDLSSLPSPFLDGACDALLAAYPQIQWAGVWETNRGCPFACTFCDWGSAVQSKVAKFEMERLRAEMRWFAEHKMAYIYCCDANFGMLPRDLQLTDELVEIKRATGYPRKVITQMSKNTLERAYEVQKRLYEAGMHVSATLSLQTVSPESLKAIRRDNISLEVYAELLRRFRAEGIPTYTDMLVGLPGDSLDSFLNSIAEVITQGQHQEIRFWNVYVLPNAEMAAPEYRAEHALETVFSVHASPFVPVRKPVAGVPEIQEMIVATRTMSREDWVGMRVAAWLSQILYFGKLLQLPLLILQQETGLTPADFLRAFMFAPLPPGAGLLAYLRQYLFQHARAMLEGHAEYVAAPDIETGVVIWYPVQSYALTYLLYSPQLSQFFRETQALLGSVLHARGVAFSQALLSQSLSLSEAYFLTYHPERRVFRQTVHYNLWELYQGILKGQPVELCEGEWLVSSEALGSNVHVRSLDLLVQEHSGFL